MKCNAKGAVGRSPRRGRCLDEVTVRKVLELHRERERKLTVTTIALKCGVSVSSVQRIIRGYRDGTIDGDGLKTMPLFPEVFRSG
jgi:response regulator of citrate/malate metabolism